MAMLPWVAKLGGIALPVSYRAIRRTQDVDRESGVDTCGASAEAVRKLPSL
jgi:hypothetical protein